MRSSWGSKRTHGYGGDALAGLARVAFGEGRLEEAAELYSQAGRERLRFMTSAAIELQQAEIERLQGNHKAAAARVVEAERLASTATRPYVVGVARITLAGLADAQGDDAAAPASSRIPSRASCQPSLTTQVFMSAIDQWTQGGHEGFALRLAERFVAIAYRDGSAKHQAVALYGLASADKFTAGCLRPLLLPGAPLKPLPLPAMVRSGRIP